MVVKDDYRKRHGDALVICWADGRCSADARQMLEQSPTRFLIT